MYITIFISESDKSQSIPKRMFPLKYETNLLMSSYKTSIIIPHHNASQEK